MESDIIDLHTHSTISDGTLTPTQLVILASQKKIKAIALTDHDSVSGIEEALIASKEYSVEVVSGVELSVQYDYELHILGLLIDHNDENLKSILGYLQENRFNRNIRIIEQLKKFNINIELSELPSQDEHSVTRAHFARLLVEKGYCENTAAAYNKYLGFGAPCYVPRERLSVSEAIKLIHLSGGMAFLAHLNQIDIDEKQLINLISDLKEMGLDGIEGLYYEYDKEWTERCAQIADIFDLAICGGSDFHGSNKKNELGVGSQDRNVPYSVLKKLKKRVEPIDIEDIV